MKLKCFKSAIAVLILSISSFANAGIIWQLNDFTFDNGALATGYFEWDAVNNALLDWEITLSSSSNGSPLSYSSSNGSSHTYSDDDYLQFMTSSWWFRISLSDLDILDTASASLFLLESKGYTGSTGYLECEHCGKVRYGSNSNAFLSAVIVDVPEPSTLAIFALGLMALVSGRFKKR